MKKKWLTPEVTKNAPIISSVFLFILFAIVVTPLAGSSYYEGIVFAYSNNETVAETTYYLKERNIKADEVLEKYSTTSISIASTDGEYSIPATQIAPNKNPNGDTVILIHGFAKNRFATLPVAEMFLAKGFNVVMYDQLSSGSNLGQKTTYGYRESYDLVALGEHLRASMDDTQHLLVWGTNTGASTAIIGSAREPGLFDALILDDSFLSLFRYLTEDYMENAWQIMYNAFAFLFTDINLRAREQFCFRDMYLPDWVATAPDVPILALEGTVNGEAQIGSTLVSYSDSPESLTVAIPNESEGELLFADPEGYADAITQFLSVTVEK